MCVNPDTMVGAMWLRHLINLIFRSWAVMVTATGTNTLGFFVWTLALTVMGWLATVGDGYYKNYRQHAHDPLASAFRDSWFTGVLLLAGVSILVLVAWAFSTVVVVYQDHTLLVNSIAQLEGQLQKHESAIITLRIKGWIGNQDQDHNAIVQLWLAVNNSGDDSQTLSNWELAVRTSDKTFTGRHTIGQPPLKGGLNIPFLDKEFQRPVGAVADMQGYVTFIVLGIDQARFDKLYLDRQATLAVTAIDSRERTIKAEKNIYETWAEGHRRTPAK
jgi:hypothetical protein